MKNLLTITDQIFSQAGQKLPPKKDKDVAQIPSNKKQQKPESFEREYNKTADKKAASEKSLDDVQDKDQPAAPQKSSSEDQPRSKDVKIAKVSEVSEPVNLEQGIEAVTDVEGSEVGIGNDAESDENEVSLEGDTEVVVQFTAIQTPEDLAKNIQDTSETQASNSIVSELTEGKLKAQQQILAAIPQIRPKAQAEVATNAEQQTPLVDATAQTESTVKITPLKNQSSDSQNQIPQQANGLQESNQDVSSDDILPKNDFKSETVRDIVVLKDGVSSAVSMNNTVSVGQNAVSMTSVSELAFTPHNASHSQHQATMTSVAQTPITQQFIQIHTPQVINQVAAAILQSDGDQKVTIRLDPPELGKVDIDMKFTDRGITVAVSAERSESVELMRRNANELLRELRESGLSLSLSDMSFGQQKQDQKASSQSGNETVFFNNSEQSSYTTQKSQMQPTVMAANVNVSMSDRLDLRL